MGIQGMRTDQSHCLYYTKPNCEGLLPLLKSIQRPTELKKYHGETIGVDAYVWLHRGAVSCAIELAEGKPTRK